MEREKEKETVKQCWEQLKLVVEKARLKQKNRERMKNPQAECWTKDLCEARSRVRKTLRGIAVCVAEGLGKETNYTGCIRSEETLEIR